MNSNKHYQVREFADMAGVTVRTLQYYDRIGVLEPSQKTQAQHRLYERKDLLKLQQILTLKQLGFSLKEIKDMIQRPEYDLQSALKAQKEAIDQQIEQLQQVSQAMDQALTVLHETETWDWEKVQYIIQGMTDRHYLDWIRKYFDDEQIAWIMERNQDTSLEEIQQGTEAWRKIYDTMRNLQHLPPRHPDLQALAKQADHLIESFVQGNEDVRQSLKHMYQNLDDIPPAYRLFDDDLFAFYSQVMDIYYQNKNGDQ